MPENKKSRESHKILPFVPRECPNECPDEEDSVDYLENIEKLELAIELERDDIEQMSRVSLSQNQNLCDDMRLLYRSRNFDAMCCDFMRGEMGSGFEQLDV